MIFQGDAGGNVLGSNGHLRAAGRGGEGPGHDHLAGKGGIGHFIYWSGVAKASAIFAGGAWMRRVA